MTTPLEPDEGRWPDAKTCAVVVTVNFDAELGLLGPHPDAAALDKTLSIYRYGAVRGAPRLLETLARRGVRSTWFVPGAVASSYRELLEAVVAGGHGLGLRGMALERLDRLSEADRHDVLRAARAALAPLSPTDVGFRLPEGEWPPGLGAQLVEAGYDWSSSWTGDDLPFALPAGTGRSIVEVPWGHTMNDRIAFAWNFAPPIPSGQSRIASYDDVLENWLLELEGCRREGLCLVVQLHPEVVGTPGRIGLLDRFLDAVLGPGDAWVATGGEVASWWAEHAPANGLEHPVDLLQRVAPASLF